MKNIERFRKSYKIRSSECNRHDLVHVQALMGLFQDITEIHAYKAGFGINFCKENGVTWVATDYHIKINRRPEAYEKIFITSWTSEVEALFATKEFIVADKLGNILITASSRWMLVDIVKRRPIRSLENYLPHHPIIKEKLLNSNLREELLAIEREDFKIDYYVRLTDIDRNQHVNNAVYTTWANEAVHPDFRKDHTPIEFEISFKKEAIYGETVWIFTQIDDLVSTHNLITNTGKEVSRIRITWKKD